MVMLRVTLSMDTIKFVAFTLTQIILIGAAESTGKVTSLQASYKAQYLSSTPTAADLLIWSITAPENSTIFVKIGPHLGETKCVSYFAEIHEPSLSPDTGLISTKPRLTQFCPEADPSGFLVDRYYRSGGSSLSIVYFKSSDIERFSASYQIDDCVCRKGPACKEPCSCPFNYGGRECSTKTCRSPAVAHATLKLRPGTGFSDNRKFSLGSVVSIRCDAGYKLKGVELMTCSYSGFVEEPPSCIKEEHFFETRCENMYDDPARSNELPQRGTREPSYNRINAQYEPMNESYAVGTGVLLRCSRGYYLEGTFELSQMVTYCGTGGKWTVAWPRCQGNFCSKPTLRNGQVKLADSADSRLPREYTIGTRLVFVCDAGFYLIGARLLTCTKHMFWDRLMPECVDQDVFRNRCTMNGKKIKFKLDENGGMEVPYCENGEVSVSLNTLTVVTASAATVFGVLLLVIALVAYQRRRILGEIRRARRRRSVTDSSSEPGHVQFNFSSTFHFVLPSYDEAMRSRSDSGPPTFDEAMQGRACGETNVALPPYSSLATLPASNEFGNLPVYAEDDVGRLAGDETTCDLIYQALSGDDVVDEADISSSAMADVPDVECRRGARLSSCDSLLIDDHGEESRLL